ncbi:MAG: outer membrane beta-barrel family protein [Ginsengibacter sp.]
MKYIIATLLTCFTIFSVNAQYEGNSARQQQNGRIYGKVVDAKTNRGLDAVSVQLIKKISNTVNGSSKDSIVAGMLTPSNGNFSFDNVLFGDSLKLFITAIGYGTLERTIMLRSNPSQGNEKDLGNFKITQESKVLENITVTSTKPALEMGIDRKIFNVEKSLTATGGTAIDVMKSIPSVTVDVDGNVQLRNASPLIFVDGRPTILTLDQIPADNIERVELITNPSAKFDAASTAGIINVVLKKNRKAGFNGIASVSAGVPGILSSNLTLNLRQGKFNFFASGNYNKSGGRVDGKTFRQNKNNGVTENYFNQYSWNNRMREFKSARFGLDFFLDNRNTITVSQNFVKGKFTNDEEQSQEYLNSSKILERTGERFSQGSSGFNRSSTQLNYTHKFLNPGKEITADVNYNTGSNDNKSNIINSYFKNDGTAYSLPNHVRNVGDNANEQLTVQVDLVSPKGENAKFESGVRTFIQSNNSIFNAYALDPAGAETKLPLSNNYKYKEMVNAFYVTYSNKINKFSYQAGIRAEQSKFDGELIDKGQKFGYDYPRNLKNIWDALFPSLFLTQTIGEGEDIQINYTKRIRRPDFRRLNPFIDINDPVNLRQGNPALSPEYTNSFEFNYNKTYKSGSFLGVIYYSNNQGDITQYSDTITAAQYQQLNNAAIDPNAILNTFINAQSTNSLGADFTLQQKLAKNFDIVPNVNLRYQKVNAVVNNIDLSNEGFNWEAKLIINYKIEAKKSSLFSNLGFQVIGEYEGPEVIPQGKNKEQYSVDFALRKDMFKEKKGTLTFSINDVFNTNRMGTIYDTENFYQDSYRRWNVRNFRLTFSYKFGNSKTSLFKRKDNQGREENDDNGNE